MFELTRTQLDLIILTYQVHQGGKVKQLFSFKHFIKYTLLNIILCSLAFLLDITYRVFSFFTIILIVSESRIFFLLPLPLFDFFQLHFLERGRTGDL